MENLTVMVVDASARAHAVSEAYERSPNVKRIIVSPGNDFIGFNRKKEVVIAPGKLTDAQSFLAVAQQYKPDLVDVCQDDALAVGTVDLLKENGFNVFGPSAAASQLEADKRFSRLFMKRNMIPSPWFFSFSNEPSGIEFVEGHYGKNARNPLLFVKAAGLCAGKGAIAVRNLEEAAAAIKKMASFGNAGKEYLIEEGMVGEEASIYSFSDGVYSYTVKSAQDHKRRDNYELGPNTGGMGAVSPAGVVTDKLMGEIQKLIVSRAIAGMNREGTPYVGVLYTSIMTTKYGPEVVEFNARWGAPEAEVVVPGIKTRMDEIAFACINGDLHKQSIEEDGKVRVCVVGASRGYPDDVSAVKGKRIYGLDEVMRMPDVRVYGAGIKVQDGKFYANGGRLFSISAEGSDILEARSKALTAMSFVSIEGNNLQYRTDIGWRDIERSRKA